MTTYAGMLPMVAIRSALHSCPCSYANAKPASCRSRHTCSRATNRLPTTDGQHGLHGSTVKRDSIQRVEGFCRFSVARSGCGVTSSTGCCAGCNGKLHNKHGNQSGTRNESERMLREGKRSSDRCSVCNNFGVHRVDLSFET